MDLINDNNLICSLFKGKKVATFGRFEHISIDDIVQIINIAKGNYVKSAFESTLDYIVVNDEFYTRCSKHLFRPYQDISLLYNNVTKNHIHMISESEFFQFCGIGSLKKMLYRYEGKSIFYPLSNYIVLDIICTGYDYYLDEVLEISAIKVKNNLISERFTVDIKSMDFSNDYLIKVLRGNIQQPLIRYTLEEAIIKYVQFIEDLPIVSDRAVFKNNLIFYLYHGTTLQFMNNNYVDILQLASNILPRIKKITFGSVGKKLNINLDYNQTNAMAWCEKIYQCYEILKKKSRFKDVSNFQFNMLKDKIFVLEGIFESISRQLILDILEKCGAKVYKNLVNSVDFLLLSDTAYCDYVNGKKSKKQVQAESFIMDGSKMLIISENMFKKFLYYNCMEIDSSLVSTSTNLDKYNLLS